MELGGVIFGVVAIALLTYLGLLMMRRRDALPVVEESSEEFPAAARIVRRAESETVGDDVEVSTPCTRRARMYELRIARATHAVRARRALLGAVLLTIGAGVAAALHRLPWWTVLIGLALIALTLVVSRLTVALLAPGFERRAAAIREGDMEDTIVLHLPLDLDEGRGVELTTPITFAGSLWDPVPVTVPTYVQKPLAPRTVRTIDLSAPNGATVALPPTADAPTPAATPAEAELPRAVGE